MNKGQIISIDLTLSIMVFVLLLGFLYFSWQSNVSGWEQQRHSLELEEKAMQQARNLVESSGFPANWTPITVEVIGLAIQPNVLSMEKIGFFANMDYNMAREKMNIFNYNFRIEITSTNPTLDQNIGAQPSASNQVSTIEHQILIEGEHAVLRFQLFR
ncbi:hypothetical protein KKE06_03845 [Candidatus Micrarchaeota archaeon]|nr:hypothetical protein [Candidatus Micrarchaeota archaeon]